MRAPFLFFVCLALGCNSTKTPENLAEVRPSVLVGKNPVLRRPDLQNASLFLKALSESAKGYFTSEQVFWYGSDSNEIWHPALNPDMEGLPVRYSDYVFPGGKSANFECDGFGVSHGTEARAIAGTLQTDCPKTPGFIFIYTTGPGTGARATATIRALYALDGVVAQEAHLFVEREEVRTRFLPERVQKELPSNAKNN